MDRLKPRRPFVPAARGAVIRRGLAPASTLPGEKTAHLGAKHAGISRLILDGR